MWSGWADTKDMANRFLAWLNPSSGQLKAPPAPRAAPVPKPVPAELPPAAIVGAAEPALGRPAEADRAALEVALRAEIARAIDAIGVTLGTSAEADDGRGLLEDIRRDPLAVIRRPPLAAQQALAACRDVNSSFGRILESFHQDPALTQALLKHANSPYYAAGGTTCNSLHDAAQRVGLAGLHTVLTAATVEGLLCRPGGDYAAMVQQIWTHLVRTAPVARRLARSAKVPSEMAYTLGLLHDLGKLIIFDRLSARRAATRHTARLTRGFLHEVLGELHGPLGGLAALQWSLDPDAARAIATHPRGEYRYRDETMSQVLAIAEWADLTTVREQPRDYDGLWARGGLTLDLAACREVLEEGR